MGDARLHAVMVTFERPDVASSTLEALRSQTRPPDSITIVDNSRLTCASVDVSRLERSILIRTGENLGPAGGLEVGVRHLMDVAEDSDWIVFVDDDDPPPDARVLEHLFSFGQSWAASTLMGGVGLAGGRFDLAMGLLHRVPDDELRGTVSVDYLGGNQFPCYPVRALRTVGGPRSDLFFGFDDLELGLRLRAAGHRLLVDGDGWLARRVEMGRTGLTARGAAQVRRRSDWRRYYGARNLVLLSRTYGSRRAAMITTARSVLLAAAADVVRARSVRGGRAAVRGGIDGWRGNLGRRVAPGLEER